MLPPTLILQDASPVAALSLAVIPLMLLPSLTVCFPIDLCLMAAALFPGCTGVEQSDEMN